MTMNPETEQNTGIMTQPADDNSQHLKAVAQRAYLKEQKKPVDDELIVQMLPLVNSIARKVQVYIKPPISFEDLVAAGTLGLVKASKNYDPSYNAEFQTYAYLRIKGAIIDELRKNSMLPTAVNSFVKKTFDTAAKMYLSTGSVPADEQLADKLDIDVSKLYQVYENARVGKFVSIDSLIDENKTLVQTIASKSSDSPDSQMLKEELLDTLADAIETLPEKEKQVIILYYNQQLNMKQIAELLNVSEPRVSQIHAKAVFNLMIKIRRFQNG